MKFLSPSHAWAKWLNRPVDLILASSNAASLQAALNALHLGDSATADMMWRGIDGDELLQAWNATVTAMSDRSLWPSSLAASPESKEPPETKALTQSISRQVFERDGFRCRYCGVPVVTQWKNGDIPRLIAALGDPSERLSVVDGSLSGSGKSGALTNADASRWLWVTAVADHVEPASLGGKTDMSNLVTACSGCNYSKADWTLAQLQVLDPRHRQVGR